MAHAGKVHDSVIALFPCSIPSPMGRVRGFFGSTGPATSGTPLRFMLWPRPAQNGDAKWRWHCWQSVWRYVSQGFRSPKLPAVTNTIQRRTGRVRPNIGGVRCPIARIPSPRARARGI